MHGHRIRCNKSLKDRLHYVEWEQMTFPADVVKKLKIEVSKRDAVTSADFFCMQGLQREVLLEYGLIEATDKWNVDTEVSVDLGEEIERLESFHGASLLVVASEIELERLARHF